MSDVVDGVWSVIVRYAGKECMFVLAPIRHTGDGDVEELPVEFTKAQSISAKGDEWRADEAKRWADELNGGPCRECGEKRNEGGECPCDWLDDDTDDIEAEVNQEIVEKRKREEITEDIKEGNIPF